MTDIKNQNHNAKAHTHQTFIVGEEAGKSVEEVLNKYQSNILGLTKKQAKKRLEEVGANEVIHEKAPPAWYQLLQAFNNPFIFVLIALAIVTFFTDYLLPLRQDGKTDLTAVTIIVIMVLLSAFLRFWQEYRTNKAAEALKSLVHTTATVIRRDKTGESKTKEVPMKCLVPGDIVLLSAGDMIPADLRLMDSRDLFISQAILTGESIPVEKYDTFSNDTTKSSHAPFPSNTSTKSNPPSTEAELLEMANISLMGTNVTSGTARGIVVATGANTYFGSLAKSIVGNRSQTAFDKGVNSVSWLLVRFMVVMVIIVLLINGFTKGNWFEAILFSLAVAVGLTPEMLPMIVSSNLAKGAIAMSKHKVVVKRLNAIQNFGAMDVLCTDKTGTLTQDRIILEHYLDNQGEQDNSVLKLAWLNSHHQSGTKNLMDKAVIRRTQNQPKLKKNLLAYLKVDELPFDFIRRRLSVSVRTPQDQVVLICKGAAEEMLTVCQNYYIKDQSYPLDATAQQKIMTLVNHYNQQGFRVLLIATRTLNDEEASRPISTKDEQGLALRGILTFLDPPKDSAIAAISALKENGVTVKVLTGDNAIITAKICQDIDLNVEHILSGPEIEAMNEAQLKTEVEKTTVFCKLTPLQKAQILKLLQENGHTVGFLGDGINDSPALRGADVGISVDTASDIAKESADIILLEKDLMVLEQGVIKGRETFGNIIKYLNMTASSNFGNVFSVLIASAFIPFLPMLAIQLLVQNLLYDISQLSLPWDTMDKEFLMRPRKWDAGNIGRFMVWIGPTSSIFDITTFALMWFVFHANNLAAESLFQSGWFVEGLISQTLVVHMLRTQKIPFFQSTAALPVLLTTVIIMALALYIPFSSFGTIIGLQPLPISYFPWLVLTLLCYCILSQLMKTIYIQKFGHWL